MIYKYDTRYIVEFKDKTRASYSAKRYGPLLELVTQQAEQEDRKIWNYYIKYEDYVEIQYWEQKTETVKSILIDYDMIDIVYNSYWQLNHNGYAQTRANGQKTYLHHLVMNTNTTVDHINRIRTDNRRCNLRVCNTFSDNGINQSLSVRNTSGHVGVWFDSDVSGPNKWRGRFQYKYKEYTQYFATYEEACAWVDSEKDYIIKYQKTFND